MTPTEKGILVARDAHPDLTIGILDGDEDLVFGRITDLAVGPDGSMLVLDRMSLDLRWFDLAGEIRGRAGRKGSGPGEFMRPLDLAVGENGRVFVTDGPLRRLTVFSMDNEGLLLVDDYPLSRWGRQFCLLDSSLLVLDPVLEENTLLHWLTSEGEVSRSFGELLSEVPPEVTATGYSGYKNQNTGSLWCSPVSGRVFLLHYNLPYLRAFDEDGREVWRTRLSDVFGMHLSVVGEDMVAHGPNPMTGAVDQGQAIFPWGPDTLAVSLERVPFPPGESSYEVRLFRATTGEELRRLQAPMIVTGMDPERFYGYVNHPFPQVFTFRR